MGFMRWRICQSIYCYWIAWVSWRGPKDPGHLRETRQPLTQRCYALRHPVHPGVGLISQLNTGSSILETLYTIRITYNLVKGVRTLLTIFAYRMTLFLLLKGQKHYICGVNCLGLGRDREIISWAVTKSWLGHSFLIETSKLRVNYI